MQEAEIKKLLEDMTLPEKVGQMMQLMGAFYMEDLEQVLTGPNEEMKLKKQDIGLAGSILNTYGEDTLKELQTSYMENHPHHIPMLFMMDAVHGFKTIFPIPLALGASFEPELAEKCASVIAWEAAASGIHVVFSPMLDLVRDARWGRVMESVGEDPYLNSLFAAAQIKGFQGEDMSDPGKVCACIKHFAGYGAAEGGREYNCVQLSEHALLQDYLTGYQAAVDAGAGMVMTAFNTINDIPATANKWLMRKILREKLGFEGVLISDFSAVKELIPHGYAENEEDAARKALEAGVDIDMMTTIYWDKLPDMAEKGIIDEKLIDQAVLRILQLKNKLGLFEHPLKGGDSHKEKEVLLSEDNRKIAREAAAKSFVLLKNQGILPLDLKKKIAFIGPYTDNKEINSIWAFSGDTKDCVTIKEAAEKRFSPDRTTYCTGGRMLSRQEEERLGIKEGLTEQEELELKNQAIEAAREAEIVVMPLGEHYLMSGEGASRANLNIPEVQMELFRSIREVNPNIVVLLFNGRPLDLREIKDQAKAVLEVWLPGTEGGNAIVDVLTGAVNPSGKLPISFPYCVGQVPVYYNHLSTGRPYYPGADQRFSSRYLDIPNEALYPFGYGLSYTTFRVGEISLSKSRIAFGDSVRASVQVENTGKFTGTEVIQLYIQDTAASVARPVKELKGIQKVTLKPGEKKEVSFEIEESMLRFLTEEGQFLSERGAFKIWIGDSSAAENAAEFYLE